jgi:hypothetical protein
LRNSIDKPVAIAAAATFYDSLRQYYLASAKNPGESDSGWNHPRDSGGFKYLPPKSVSHVMVKFMRYYYSVLKQFPTSHLSMYGRGKSDLEKSPIGFFV